MVVAVAGHIGFAVIIDAEKWFAASADSRSTKMRVLLPDGGTKLVYF